MVGMVGGSADPAFDAKFREFLQEPDTQDVIRADQKKEMDIMRKMDEMEKLEELQGQREQLAVAMVVACRATMLQLHASRHGRSATGGCGESCTHRAKQTLSGTLHA